MGRGVGGVGAEAMITAHLHYTGAEPPHFPFALPHSVPALHLNNQDYWQYKLYCSAAAQVC